MSPKRLCPYHRGCYLRGLRFYAHLTRKERHSMADQIAAQCATCKNQRPPARHLSRDPEDPR